MIKDVDSESDDNDGGTKGSRSLYKSNMSIFKRSCPRDEGVPGREGK